MITYKTTLYKNKKKALIKRVILVFLMCFFETKVSFSTEIAITFDDLPVHENIPFNTTRLDVANQMLAALKKHHIHDVYGFINDRKIGSDPGNYKVLEAWVNQGQMLGNHTASHLDLFNVNAVAFIEDIEANEPTLGRLMGDKNFKYFRYPYLSEGEEQVKRDKVRQHLFAHDYQIAQVTVDFLDYEWNEPYNRCLAMGNKEAIEWLKKTYIEQSLHAITIAHELSILLFGHEIKHILLLHFGAFDAIMLDKLLTAYERKKVHFIPLSEALNDSVYQLNPNVIAKRPYTFLNQIRVSMGIENTEGIQNLYNSLPEAELERLCRNDAWFIERHIEPAHVLRALK